MKRRRERGARVVSSLRDSFKISLYPGLSPWAKLFRLSAAGFSPPDDECFQSRLRRLYRGVSFAPPELDIFDSFPRGLYSRAQSPLKTRRSVTHLNCAKSQVLPDAADILHSTGAESAGLFSDACPSWFRSHLRGSPRWTAEGSCPHALRVDLKAALDSGARDSPWPSERRHAQTSSEQPPSQVAYTCPQSELCCACCRRCWFQSYSNRPPFLPEPQRTRH